MRTAVSCLFLAALSAPLLAQSHVAPTDAKTPAEERATFKLPPGFEAQLVASEPDIGKPIQMAFDARGRLWVTTSRHYPFPAAKGEKPSDRLFVLSDFAPDGKARKVETFAADLNIPIGVLPLPDGKSCLVSHVGSILKLTDTDGDGKADQRETILTGFGTRDTHGMMNSFVLRPDGWVYACHGYLNSSTVVAKDGSKVTMQSGHTFRFRPDGSRVEPWTYGQVNPFGMTTDPWGNLYTADCHSKPITQLIRGAYYDSFGKPHDGLGYAPHVTQHDHKSTALCGLAWYDADQFPKEWNGVMFLGNVTANRVNADRIVWKGATPVAEELPDFLVSSDLWFRPTDIKLGPDGALYVADFYNKIIGHYEVDLKHPGRDKDRGRVWRIVYKGDGGGGKADKPAVPYQAEVLRLNELGSQAKLRRAELSEVRAALAGPPMVAKAAAEALIAHAWEENIGPLVELLRKTPAEDTHLRHAARVALRNSFARLSGSEMKPADERILADVALGIPTVSAGDFLARHLELGSPDQARVPEFAYHIGRYCPQREGVVAGYVRGKLAGDPTAAVATLRQLVRAAQARGGRVGPAAADVVLAVAAAAVVSGPATAGVELAKEAMPRMPGGRGEDSAQRRLFDAVVAATKDTPLPVRIAACDAVATDPEWGQPILRKLCEDGAAPAAVRERAAVGLANLGRPEATTVAVTFLEAAPAKSATAVAVTLAGNKAGASALLTSVKLGKASPRLLQDKQIRERLDRAGVPDLAAKVAELTKDLPAPEARLEAVLRDRAAGFRKAKPDEAKGKALFTQHCAVCHQLGGAGAKVGPQLDGVGSRGLDRLLEDVLDPNRNVDEAFRTRVVELKDGRTVSGAFLRVDGQVWVLADQQGKDVRVPLAEVESWKLSPLSPMPATFDTAMPAEDFYHLMGYLLQQRAK
ncbi:MAG: PVC-type heme-binding CxxCH protein [Gemmataceae bacterium]